MAAYTCTPLVKFPVAALKPGQHYKGTTVAELGNHNSPLDMIVYQKDGKDYILLANSSRGVMKIKTEGIADAPSISRPYRRHRRPALRDDRRRSRASIQLDTLDKDHALVLVQAAGRGA